MSERRMKKLRQISKKLFLPYDFLKKQYKGMNWKERTAIMGNEK